MLVGADQGACAFVHMKIVIRKEYKMRSPKVLLIGSIITDIVLIIYLLTLTDEIGYGMILLLSILLLGGTLLTYKLMNRV
jgi:hypothetical protein